MTDEELIELLKKIKKYIEKSTDYQFICTTANNFISGLPTSESEVRKVYGDKFVNWIIRVGKRMFSNYEFTNSWGYFDNAKEHNEFRIKEIDKFIKELETNQSKEYEVNWWEERFYTCSIKIKANSREEADYQIYYKDLLGKEMVER